MSTSIERRERIIAIALAVCLVALILVSLTVGTYGITVPQILGIIWRQVTGAGNAGDQAATVLLVIRLPRIVLAAMVGAALALSGAAYQGMFRNPMVSPDILGVSSGAGVGAAVALLLGLPTLAVHAFSFACGVGAVLLVMALARAVGGKSRGNLVVMILAGVILSSVFSALTSLVKYLADADDLLPEITFWLMGSFARSGSEVNVFVMGAALAIGAIVLLALRWKVNILSFGEEEARTMGVNTGRVRTAIILAATLLTSASVCICGNIGWVGLIIPHVSRLMVGPNYKTLFPVSLLGGACFMLLVDDVARVIVPGELPIGVLTALIGAPIFLFLLIKGRKEWL